MLSRKFLCRLGDISRSANVGAACDARAPKSLEEVMRAVGRHAFEKISERSEAPVAAVGVGRTEIGNDARTF